MTRSSLSTVRDFWDETPCDTQSSYAQRFKFRYAKEPWLLPLLERIASRYRTVLEVGCGQGTDGVSLCRLLPGGATYTGVDMSTVSLASAREAAASVSGQLQVAPQFREGNGEQLQFPDGSFDCVLSVGALHHSENTRRAIAEVRRVLQPGGTAFILLYRKLSPKLLVANTLRGVQQAVDRVAGTDRVFYQLMRSARVPQSLGTALQECFGVPIMHSYSRGEVRALFKEFSSLRLSSHGIGLPPIAINKYIETPLSGLTGYLWLAEAVK